MRKVTANASNSVGQNASQSLEVEDHKGETHLEMIIIMMMVIIIMIMVIMMMITVIMMILVFNRFIIMITMMVISYHQVEIRLAKKEKQKAKWRYLTTR